MLLLQKVSWKEKHLLRNCLVSAFCSFMMRLVLWIFFRTCRKQGLMLSQAWWATFAKRRIQGHHILLCRHFFLPFPFENHVFLLMLQCHAHYKVFISYWGDTNEKPSHAFEAKKGNGFNGVLLIPEFFTNHLSLSTFTSRNCILVYQSSSSSLFFDFQAWHTWVMRLFFVLIAVFICYCFMLQDLCCSNNLVVHDDK